LEGLGVVGKTTNKNYLKEKGTREYKLELYGS
jgi:hypothetical protein